MRSLPLAGLILLPAASFAIIPDYGTDTFFTGVGQLGGASCVAIAPHWVITARHVGGTTVNFEGTNYTAFERFDHDEADISLLHFNQTLPNFYAIDYADPTGRTGTLVGFGGTGTAGATGINITGGAGIRRAADNVIDEMDTVTFDNIDFFDAWVYDLDGPSGNGSTGGPAVAHEGGLWGGDSGGGWFVQNGSQWNLVATNSFVADNTNNNQFNDYGDLGGGVALRSYETWIQGHVVPEPGSMGVLGLGLVALLRRRKR